MKKSILAIAAALTLCGNALASNEGYVVDRKGRRMEVEGLDAETDGRIEFKKGKFTQKLKKNDYREAWLKETPVVLREAFSRLKKGDDKNAAKIYEAAYSKYRWIGFDVKCITGAGMALSKLGDTDKAISWLQNLMNMKSINPVKQADYYQGLELLQELYVKKKMYNEADRVAAILGRSEDPNIAATALVNRGKMLDNQGKKKDAALLFMRVALLFAKSNKERPEAIFQTAQVLKSLNDARWKDWANMLRNDYPKSPLNNKLQ